MTEQEMTCPHCGTQWVFATRGDRSVNSGGVSGFIIARIRHHITNCGQATPAARLAGVRKTARRRNIAKHTYLILNYDFVVAQTETGNA